MSALIRIGLRYLAAVLVARGLLLESDANMLANDPEMAAMIEAAIGAAIGAITEGWYMLARKYGWNK